MSDHTSQFAWYSPICSCLSGILINRPPFSFKNIFIGMINYMVISHLYHNAKGISHLIVFNKLWESMENRSGTVKLRWTDVLIFKSGKKGGVVISRLKNTDLVIWGADHHTDFCDDFERKKAATKREHEFIKTKLGELHLNSFFIQATVVHAMGFL